MPADQTWNRRQLHVCGARAPLRPLLGDPDACRPVPDGPASTRASAGRGPTADDPPRISAALRLGRTRVRRRWSVFVVALCASGLLAAGFGVAISRLTAAPGPAPSLRTLPPGTPP